MELHGLNIIYANPKNLHERYVSLINKLTVRNQSSGTIINFKYPSINDKSVLGREGVDIGKLHFIDGITLIADLIPKEEDIYVLLNLEDLSGITTGINTILKKNPDMGFMVIDILDALQFYNSIQKIQTLMTDLRKICMENHFPAFIFVNEANSTLIEGLTSIVDHQFATVPDFEIETKKDESSGSGSKQAVVLDEKISLSAMEVDALKEIGNIGSGNASTQLSNIISQKVEMELTNLQIIPTEDFFNQYQNQEQDHVVSTFLRVEGDISGSIVTMFNRENATKLVDIIKNQPPGTLQEINEESKEYVTKIGKEVTDSYLKSLTDFLGIQAGLQDPIFAVNKKNVILSFMVRLIKSNLNKDILMINTRFSVPSQGLKGEFLLLFGLGSLKKFQELIRQKLGLPTQ